ncbi:hypothetical protein VNO80_22451 [Phaseolus coccineus]|uniref:Uncharacterized protein n=1 Tax=Phaseolus coccineus TaxID=3886 RepID=A0AAN9M541_PHACN
MNGEHEGTHSEEKDGNGYNTGGVIFLLNNLPLYYDPEEEFTGTLHTVPYHIGNLAATYNLPVGQILSSRLNAAGFIRNICINFGPMGCCELNPNTRLSTQFSPFLRQLHQLFQYGILYNPEDGEVACRMRTNLSSLLSTLPANCRKIGCIHGPVSLTQGSIMNLRDYLRAATDEQILLFVVGQIDTEIYPYIDDFVQVSDFELVATHGLIRVISAMETKLGLISSGNARVTCSIYVQRELGGAKPALGEGTAAGQHGSGVWRNRRLGVALYLEKLALITKGLC